MKIGILGAGVSGLSVGKLLAEKFDVEILERASNYGGIARTRSVDGVSYHVTGGHCFNSKFTEVLDFVFDHVMALDKWHMVERDAIIRFGGHEISYPIEFAIKEIFKFNKALAIDIIRDFFNSNDDSFYPNLDIWFRKKFGDTLSEQYFLPYNTKIWNMHPSKMDPSWVRDKLPIPDAESFVNGLINNAKDLMPHSCFYYPNSNDQNSFLDCLAEKLNITLNFDIEDIDYNPQSKKWIVNGCKHYDLLITTLPLNIFPRKLKFCPQHIIEAASKLAYNKVTTVLWKTRPTKRTWTYLPSSDTIFHRYIHIGSFFSPHSNYTITEAVGSRSYKEMIDCGMLDDFLLEPLDYHVSDHAYVVYNESYFENKSLILNYLSSVGIYSVGRFAEWDYYNMDVCIKQALELYNHITNKYNQ